MKFSFRDFYSYGYMVVRYFLQEALSCHLSCLVFIFIANHLTAIPPRSVVAPFGVLSVQALYCRRSDFGPILCLKHES